MTAQTRVPGFTLGAPPTLSRSTLIRDEVVRTDTARLAAGWPDARIVVVDRAGRSPLDPAPDGGYRLRTRPAIEFGSAPDGGPVAAAVLLGTHDGVDWWGIRGEASPGDDARWLDLRASGSLLDATGAGLLTTAVAVFNWHDAAGFCARCGSPTVIGHAGWVSRCVANGHEEYPRTDPAVICLVHDGADQVLLARQPIWPPGRYSVLAGFVEAGESLEACVAREIAEEVGVSVHGIRYLGSQAWPFPRSLMLGFTALADPAEPLRLVDGEIAEAFWASRDEIRASQERGDWALPDDGGPPPLLLPPPVSIARTMLDSWIAAG